MMPLVTIRPQPGADATIARAREMGLSLAAFPLFELRALEWIGPDPNDIDALLIGSANAIRLGGPQLERYRGKRVHAVGRVTALACQQAGFVPGTVGNGGLQQVLDRLPSGAERLLRIAGREHVALRLPPGKQVELRLAYERVDLPMPDALCARLAAGAVVLLYSAGGARHLARECSRLAIERANIRLAALGPRIAQAAGEGWAAVRFPPQVAEKALLALAADMCH